LQENDGAKRGAGGRGTGTEHGAGVITEISWSAERLSRRSRSTHMLWVSVNWTACFAFVLMNETINNFNSYRSQKSVVKVLNKIKLALLRFTKKMFCFYACSGLRNTFVQA